MRDQSKYQGPAVENFSVSAYRIPTESPESDGTLKWDSTTMVLVEAEAADTTGIGYTYGNQSAGALVRSMLIPAITGMDAFDIPRMHRAMVTAIRNQGRTGIAFMALSAVDVALWDLKGKLLEQPVIRLIGRLQDGMPVYGSGGFTSYSIDELQRQLGGWIDEGIDIVKMKTGRHADHDVERVKAAREAIGPDAELLVDANGGYTAKQAMEMGHQFADYGVSWFEEPVASDDLAGLNYIRNNVPPGMEVTAGEYGYNLNYFKDMLQARAVDVLQADATRCGGITGFLKAGTVAQSFLTPFSSHCAPAIHLHVAPALRNYRHAEYFFDHIRIEQMLFEGVQAPDDGVIYPDLGRPGLGLRLKRSVAEEYEI